MMMHSVDIKHMAQQKEVLEKVYAEPKPLPKFFLHPHSPKRLAWDVVSLFMVVIDSVVLPFQLAYYMDNDVDAWFVLGTIFFGSDIILNFFTGYEAGRASKTEAAGNVVTSHRRIAKHYVTGWFTIDLISTIPWGLFFTSLGSSGRVLKLTKIAKLARFLRLARLMKMMKVQGTLSKLEDKIGSLFLIQQYVK